MFMQVQKDMKNQKNKFFSFPQDGKLHKFLLVRFSLYKTGNPKFSDSR